MSYQQKRTPFCSHFFNGLARIAVLLRNQRIAATNNSAAYILMVWELIRPDVRDSVYSENLCCSPSRVWRMTLRLDCHSRNSPL